MSLLVPVIALGLPIFDTLFSMFRRFLERRPIFSPDRGHIHHRLLDLGLTQRRAVMILYGVSIAFAACAIALSLGRSWETGFALLSASIVVLALLSSAGEELLFRGVLQTLIGRWTTPIVGLVVASFLFGLAHALSKVYFLLATVIGFFLGWMAWYYHDLAAPIVAHAMYDFVALMYLSRSRLSSDNVSPPQSP